MALRTGSMFDYIVIGGGSAGTVLASRLTERSDTTVLLIEAGPDLTPGSEPRAIRDTFHSAVFRAENMWPGLSVHWRPVPQGAYDDAPLRRYDQARILGGGSSVNAMAAIRGQPEDYDEWQALGADGWSWADVLPFFRKLEHDLDFAGPLHGQDGPIPIRRHRRRQWPPFCCAVAETLERRGYPHVPDMNASFADGCVSVPINSLPTHRVSTATAYLTPEVRKRPNLRILTETLAVGLEMSGRAVTGVRLRSGAVEMIHHCNEVIVSAGALHSPSFLLRSGIGPANELRMLGLDVVVDLPSVGKNLQDHPTVAIAAHLRRRARQPRALRPAPNVNLRFSSGLNDCHRADCWLSIANKISWHPIGARFAALGVSVYKPYSKGRVTLRSTRIEDEPRVEFNLLSDHRDMQRIKLGMRLANELLMEPSVRSLITYAFPASFSERIRKLNRYGAINWVRATAAAFLLDGPSPLRDHVLRSQVQSGPGLPELMQSDSALEDWIGDSVTGFFHPVGTCRMGTSFDPSAVVDVSCRVHGVGGLRVVDASVMPAIVRGNTNIPTIMIAEKVSDAMRGRALSAK